VSQDHRRNFHINVEGLSFATRGNLVQKSGQVVDEFVVDHIREDLEFKQKFTPNLYKRNFPNSDLPRTFVSQYSHPIRSCKSLWYQ
jgi:hypothetical protein